MSNYKSMLQSKLSTSKKTTKIDADDLASVKRKIESYINDFNKELNNIERSIKSIVQEGKKLVNKNSNYNNLTAHIKSIKSKLDYVAITNFRKLEQNNEFLESFIGEYHELNGKK